MASSCEQKLYASIQDDVESKVHLNCKKTFSLKENLQKCARDYAVAQVCYASIQNELDSKEDLN